MLHCFPSPAASCNLGCPGLFIIQSMIYLYKHGVWLGHVLYLYVYAILVPRCDVILGNTLSDLIAT